MDSVHVEIHDWQVTNRLFYVAIGVTVNGERDTWGDEGSGFRLAAPTEIKNSGLK